MRATVYLFRDDTNINTFRCALGCLAVPVWRRVGLRLLHVRFRSLPWFCRYARLRLRCVLHAVCRAPLTPAHSRLKSTLWNTACAAHLLHALAPPLAAVMPAVWLRRTAGFILPFAGFGRCCLLFHVYLLTFCAAFFRLGSHHCWHGLLAYSRILDRFRL